MTTIVYTRSHPHGMVEIALRLDFYRTHKGTLRRWLRASPSRHCTQEAAVAGQMRIFVEDPAEATAFAAFAEALAAESRGC